MDELIYRSIARKLSGEGNEADNAAIEKWLAEDASRADAYKKLQLAWQNADKLFETPAFNTQAAWDKVSGRIQTESPVQKGKTIFFPTWAKYSIAAAAVLVMGIFVFRLQGDSTITIAANMENQVVTLPDNSKITLRKGSTLSYPKRFKDNERNVSLEGEAFFEVARNEQAPFIIDAQSASVQVLGTSFNVKCNEGAASVVVKTGKVQMTSQSNKAYVILTPGEKGNLKNGTLTEENVSADNYLYWQTGVMEFNSVPLKDIVSQLQEVTDSSIKLNTAMAADAQTQLVNISFHNQSVEEMLNELCLITQTNWHKNGNHYVINTK